MFFFLRFRTYILCDFIRRKLVIRSLVLAIFNDPHCFQPVSSPLSVNSCSNFIDCCANNTCE